MINHKVLDALEEVDKLIKDELKKTGNAMPSEKEQLRGARDKVQEAITITLKGA